MSEGLAMGTLFRNRPDYAWKLPLLAFVLNNLVYFGSQGINATWFHYDLRLDLDSLIPFLPWTASIYFGSYLFWVSHYLFCARQIRPHAYRFFCADLVGKLICLIIFLLFPTETERPLIGGDGLWDMVMRLLYLKDSPVNLLPSIHCFNSWLCYIGIRSNKQVPIIYRLASCLIALAIFISTLTTKQHYIIDVLAGAALAELSYGLASLSAVRRVYERITQQILNQAT